MKKNTFLILVSFLFTVTLIGQPETVIPSISDNPYWLKEYCSFCGGVMPGTTYQKFYDYGETVSDCETEYIYVNIGYPDGETPYIIDGHIRVDGNQVYVKSSASSCEEAILYDFDLQLGDTLRSEYYYYPEIYLRKIVVQEMNGILRRNFMLYSYDDYFEIYELSNVWIEGIGNLYGLLPSFICTDYIQCANGGETSHTWLRFSLDGEILADINTYSYINALFEMEIPINPEADVSIAVGTLGLDNSSVVWLTQQNVGQHAISNSQISLELPPGVLFSNSDPLPTDQTSNTLIWDMGSYELMAHEQIKLEVEILETADIDPNGLFYFATVGDCSNESGSNSKFASFSTSVNESSELNDIVAIPRGASDDNYIFIEQPITYTIRFQNTGTDTIGVVNILNPISENLELQSFDFLAASHDYKITGVYNGNVNWEFDNIKLPPSSTDFVGSQGFVQYRISAKQNLNPNTEIFNQAYITFDDQEPLETNTFKHTVSSDVTLAVDLLDFSAKWNQDNSRAIEWTLGNPLQMESVELERSINKRDFYPIKTILSPQFEEFNFNDELWEPNIDWWYRLKFVEQNGEVSYSEIIKLSDKNNSLESELFEFDPIAKQIKWSIPSDKNQIWEISIFDQLGRVVFAKSIEAENNLDFQYQLPNNLTGNYFIHAKTENENEVYSNRFIVFE